MEQPQGLRDVGMQQDGAAPLGTRGMSPSCASATRLGVSASVPSRGSVCAGTSSTNASAPGNGLGLVSLEQKFCYIYFRLCLPLYFVNCI